MKLTDICSKMNTINLSAIVSNVRNVAEGFSAVSASGIQFEQNLANLSSITGLIGDDLQYIADKAKETGKASGLGAAGAVDAFALLASQIQIDKIGMEGLAMLQRETITLAQASGMNMTDAATAMAATINQFGLQADQANRVINVLAAGSKYGAAEIGELSQSFKVTGSVAAAAGLSVEQTAGALEVLSKSNLKGAEAGTALRNIIVKLQTTLGLDLSKTGLANALEALQPKLEDTAYLAKLFGAENLAASQFLIKNADAVREMTDSVTGTNVAMEQANIRTNTTAEAMKRMQARIDGFKISLFEATGGLSAVAAEVAGWGVTIAQLYPVLGTLNSKFGKLITSLPVISTYLQDVKLFTILLSIRIQHLASTALSSAIVKVTAFSKALSLQSIATKAAAAAQTLFNVALRNNPIGWAVTAIAALAAGVTIAYKKCDWFRELVDKAWAS
ncbi:MAG: phage tail tape measure protein, partial [Parabacteroides sp.]